VSSSDHRQEQVHEPFAWSLAFVTPSQARIARATLRDRPE
jgi:hypothetical protein